MNSITCKFGGSSLADAEAMRRAQAIVLSNPARRFVVPSAPGKRHDDDIKITDLLYTWHNLARQGLQAEEPRSIVESRYTELVSDLGITVDITSELAIVTDQAAAFETADYMASRGEYLNGLILAKLLEATFIDPADYILLDEEGNLMQETYDRLAAAMTGDGLYVVPGFYGALPNGPVRTMSRGGSDITGAIVARATGSDLYENWTDVSGFMMADPRIVDNPKAIKELTYQELRELSYMGAQVLHDEAIYPVREPGIPINIRNTKRPEDEGTLIVAGRETTDPLCGVAGRAGFTMINIEKTLMNKERGFGRRVLTVLEEYGVGWEHMPTGIDTISLIVRDEELAHHGPAILEAIEGRCSPDKIKLAPGLAIIATVGLGMIHHVGTAGRLCTALAQAGVNLRVLDQGSSEMNIIVGVEEQDLANAVRAIYNEFAGDST
jgi:aspartate kinase